MGLKLVWFGLRLKLGSGEDYDDRVSLRVKVWVRVKVRIIIRGRFRERV